MFSIFTITESFASLARTSLRVVCLKAFFWGGGLYRINLWELNFLWSKKFPGWILELNLDFWYTVGFGSYWFPKFKNISCFNYQKSDPCLHNYNNFFDAVLATNIFSISLKYFDWNVYTWKIVIKRTYMIMD